MNEIVFRSITMQTQTRVEAESGSSGTRAEIDGWTETCSDGQRPWSLLIRRQHLDQTGFWSVRSAEIKTAAINDTLSPNWKNGETWKYAASSLSTSVASDITTNESRLIKERRPLQDFPTAPRNSQTFLFTRLSLLISWNKTRASDSKVGAGAKGHVATCRYCAEIALAGHPPPGR